VGVPYGTLTLSPNNIFFFVLNIFYSQLLFSAQYFVKHISEKIGDKVRVPYGTPT
jgi:hypothetical protein